MSKRKKEDPSPDDDDEQEDVRGKSRQQEPQKVYDFHKKTVEVYPDRLRELNRQFLASISTQVTSEPYSVLVGNCLDYVRQYFNYEDDLLKHSPWLAARLKQSRADIVNSLQETIDVYEALARQDFDRLFENKPQANGNQSFTSNNKTDSSIFANPPVVTFRPPPATTTSSTVSPVQPAKSVTTTAESTPPAPFSFTIPSSSASPAKTSTTNASPFAFSLPSTGFGTSTFASTNADKSSSLAPSTTSFTPPKFSFNPIPSNSTADQPAGGAATGDDNEEEPSEPPQPEKVDHEANAKLTYRCRMGVNKGGKLIKRGPVQVVLKDTDGKSQMIVRSDDSLGRLFLNIIWSKMIEPKKNSTKDLTFVCRLNPGMPEVAEGEFATVLFRFDNETDRNDAFEKLEKERS